VHSGQVAFPGGKKEEADSDLLVTAIRETQEEVGVLLKAESVAGALTPLYIPVSNFLVQPFVAILTGRPELQLNKNEVEAVMDFDLRAIIDPGNIREKQMQTSSGMLLTPYYELGGVEVWGATAMIISELAEIVRPLISS
jgi:8-oxo-dGTP pyrophosphatase MutT (NUDIX family)